MSLSSAESVIKGVDCSIVNEFMEGCFCVAAADRPSAQKLLQFAFANISDVSVSRFCYQILNLLRMEVAVFLITTHLPACLLLSILISPSPSQCVIRFAIGVHIFCSCLQFTYLTVSWINTYSQFIICLLMKVFVPVHVSILCLRPVQ